MFRQIKKLIVAVVGFTVLLIGIALLVLPGPAFIVIPAGIAILATEFVWARRILNSVKERFKRKSPTSDVSAAADPTSKKTKTSGDH